MPSCSFCEAETPATIWSLGRMEILGPLDMAKDGEGVIFACDEHREVLREVSDPAVEIFPISITTKEPEEIIYHA